MVCFIDPSFVGMTSCGVDVKKAVGRLLCSKDSFAALPPDTLRPAGMRITNPLYLWFGMPYGTSPNSGVSSFKMSANEQGLAKVGK